jgi:hypothetical protein
LKYDRTNNVGFHLGNNISDIFAIQILIKQGDVLKLQLLKFASDFTIMNSQEYHMGLKMNSTCRPLAYVGDMNLLEDNTNTMNKFLSDARKESGFEIT